MARGSVAFPKPGLDKREQKKNNDAHRFRSKEPAVIRIARDVFAFASVTAFTSVVTIAAALVG
jgi:hypothetical protein